MPRPRTIPDSTIFAAIIRLIEEGGERSVAFSTVARATGLAAPSLVQRYGALPQMIRAAFLGEWDRLGQIAAAAQAEVAATGKGSSALLKALSPGPGPALLAASRRDPELAARAMAWRAGVEAALVGLSEEEDRASILVALWSGQTLWEGLAPRGFKLKDAIRRLG